MKDNTEIIDALDKWLEDPANEKALIIWQRIVTTQKCFFCRTKFDKPFCLKTNNKPDFNLEMLIHFEQTHGFQPIDIFDFLVEIYGKKYPKSMSFFNKIEPLFERLSD